MAFRFFADKIPYFSNSVNIFTGFQQEKQPDYLDANCKSAYNILYFKLRDENYEIVLCSSLLQ